MNGGSAFDLHVCQKVRPWLTLWRAKWSGKPVVYDLDDNDPLFSAREARQIQRFVGAASGATAGSEFLRTMMAQWNTDTSLLDNPVDVVDQDIRHRHDHWGGRLVWFGMPENLWMLRQLRLTRPVTTITRGGDVEYSLKSIDEHLVTFDLALLPVSLNDETRAKNANRLVKCVGLGLPFLASDTAENRRAIERLRLPASFLVASELQWSARIEQLAQDYPRAKRLIQEARTRAFEVYGIEAIVRDWLAFCRHLLGERATSATV